MVTPANHPGQAAVHFENRRLGASLFFEVGFYDVNAVSEKELNGRWEWRASESKTDSGMIFPRLIGMWRRRITGLPDYKSILIYLGRGIQIYRKSNSDRAEIQVIDLKYNEGRIGWLWTRPTSGHLSRQGLIFKDAALGGTPLVLFRIDLVKGIFTTHLWITSPIPIWGRILSFGAAILRLKKRG
jgi:hypothetical protein